MSNDAANGKKLAEVREMKVRLPLSLHLRLHTVKVLTGLSISDFVTHAVERELAEEHWKQHAR